MDITLKHLMCAFQTTAPPVHTTPAVIQTDTSSATVRVALLLSSVRIGINTVPLRQTLAVINTEEGITAADPAVPGTVRRESALATAPPALVAPTVVAIGITDTSNAMVPVV